jgi:XTP/dITP diphosphohydrolase
MGAPGGAALILATRNLHKLREVGRMLTPYGIELEPLPDDLELPPEDGETFEANARPKARAAAQALGRAAIADDSGIEAEALGGAPGVRSARFARERATDQENLDKLLRAAPSGSRLRYVCALAFVDPATGQERVFFGECRGRVAGRPRGERGFGYDPAFVPDEHPAGSPEGLTMAELPDAQKDAISHRGRAVRAFADWYVAQIPCASPEGGRTGR